MNDISLRSILFHINFQMAHFNAALGKPLSFRSIAIVKETLCINKANPLKCVLNKKQKIERMETVIRIRKKINLCDMHKVKRYRFIQLECVIWHGTNQFGRRKRKHRTVRVRARSCSVITKIGDLFNHLHNSHGWTENTFPKATHVRILSFCFHSAVLFIGQCTTDTVSFYRLILFSALCYFFLFCRNQSNGAINMWYR